MTVKALIRYAPKPWDRGAPLTRTVEVPSGYTDRQIRRWLVDKLLLKDGETIEAFLRDHLEVVVVKD